MIYLNKLHKRPLGIPYIVWGVLALIGVCVFIIMQCYVPVGDDALYSVGYTQVVAKHGAIAAWPHFAVGHWLDVNGRFADKFNPFVLNVLPTILVNILVAASVVGLYAMLIANVRFKAGHITLVSLLLAVAAVALPWWDSLMLYVCWLNYILALLLSLIVIYNIDCAPKGWFLRILWFTLVVLAGGMHEACGVALACGMVVWIALNRANLSRFTLMSIAAYFCGVCICVLSPAFWHRVKGEVLPTDVSFVHVFFSTDYMVGVLMIVLGTMCLVPSGRRTLRSLIPTTFTVFAVGALASAAVSVYSGVEGRSGFFAQAFALVALFQIMQNSTIRLPRLLAKVVCVLLLSAVSIHYIGAAAYQVRLGEEMRNVIAYYQRSDDGVVFIDCTTDADVPWWVLYKARCVPDADDAWILSSIAKTYRTDSKPLVILPSDFKNVDMAAHAPVTIKGVTVDTTSPPTFAEITFEGDTLLLTRTCSGKECLVTPFELGNTRLYRICEREIDPFQ